MTPSERLRWLRETHDVGIPLDLAIAAAPLVPSLAAATGGVPCAWPKCRFTAGWRVYVPGRPDREACTTHLGFVCADGNPQTTVGVRLLAAIARDSDAAGAVSP